MVKQLRYLTFAPGELEARLRELAPKGTPIPDVSQLTNGGNGGNGGTPLKAHCCMVRYLDGRQGECRYERGGPQWHVFHYGYDGQPLPRQIWMQSLANSAAHIESKAQELASAAYREAIARERQDYFARGSEPTDGSRKRNPSLYRLTAGKAREWAGKYALCHMAGSTLIAIGTVYDTLDEANIAWLEKSDKRLVVGCCNRLDRCWQLPRFNPLYATFDPRPKPASEAHETTPTAPTAPKPQGEDSHACANPARDIAQEADAPHAASTDAGYTDEEEDADEDGCEYESYGEEEDDPDAHDTDAVYNDGNGDYEEEDNG